MFVIFGSIVNDCAFLLGEKKEGKKTRFCQQKKKKKKGKSLKHASPNKSTVLRRSVVYLTVNFKHLLTLSPSYKLKNISVLSSPRHLISVKITED